MKTYNYPSVIQGDTLNAVNMELLINEVPQDLTSVTIRQQWRQGHKAGTELRTSTIGSGITLTDAVNGQFSLDAFVCDFPVGRHFFDIEFTISGNVKTYVNGSIHVNPGVTS